MNYFDAFMSTLPRDVQQQMAGFYGRGGGGEGGGYGQMGSDPSSVTNTGTAADPNYVYNPSNPYSGVNPDAYGNDDKEGASRLFADIIRAQTEDYLNRFAPIEDFLAGSITAKGTTFLEGDLERTREAVLGGGAAAAGQYSRNLERYGVMGKQLDNSMATTSALVGGLNDTRVRDEDRKLAILGGGLGSIAPKIRSSQGAGG